MSVTAQFGYPDIPKSITNANVQTKDALDVSNPMSFILFIKTISNSFEPSNLQAYYNEYLKRWNSIKKNKEISDSELITEKYREFLKEISLNYSTLEEQKFLSNLDFNNPSDLEIALPFYSKKLIEISEYFNKKREEAKFQLLKKKLVGTNYGLQKSINDFTINYLESIQDGSFYFNIDDIKAKLEIEIEELFDTYPSYFNQTPNERIYDNKDLDWGYDIFLKTNAELLSTTFASVSSLSALKELNDLIDNKRKLTKKYLSTDFYYISTGPTLSGSTTFDFVSGKLFDVSNNAKNFLNIDYPTTASTRKNNIQTPREIGFFRPHKNAIVIIDGKNLSFNINRSALEENKIYYFPDPLVHDSELITYSIDGDYLKTNFTSGLAKNQPIQTQDGVFYQGYTSQNDITPIPDLSMLFNMGYIHDQKKDVYGNTFGLIKDNYNFRENISRVDYNYIKSMLLNGYQFFDDNYNEGFDFDYSYSDYYTTTNSTKRAGLSTYTNSFTGAFDYTYTLFFRYFTPFEELYFPPDQLATNNEILECVGFNKPNGDFHLDPISSDLSAFPGDENYYFSKLIEGGIHTLTPTIIRGLKDPLFPSITASFENNYKSNIVECGLFTDKYNFDVDFTSREYSFISDIDSTKYTLTSSISTVVERLFDRYDLTGNIYVKNVSNQQSYKITDLFSYWNLKFPIDLITELNGSIKSFDFINDVILIETSNYFMVDKVKYNSGNFENPLTEGIFINHSDNDFNKISNRFKINNDVYYCLLETLSSSLSSNNLIIYPKIYKFNTLNFTNDEIFPISISKIENNSGYVAISSNNVRYTHAENPIIIHDSRTNILNISFLIKDQNNYFSLQEFEFDINSNMDLLNHTQYFDNSSIYSNIFNKPLPLMNLNVLLSSNQPTILNENLVL
jgi:hypothetical protein